MTLKRTALACAAAGLLVLPVLAGCTPEVTAVAPPSVTEAPSIRPTDVAAAPTPTPAAEAAPVFTKPGTCSELAGADLEAVFASRNAVLFNSSNGEGIYAGTPVDTHQLGGNPFGCLWGVPDVDLNTFVLSVQSLSKAAHEGVVAILDGGGYVKTVAGDVVTYTAIGAETGEPADQLTIHVLRPDSWMTGWAALGGEASRARITEYLDAAAANLYN